MNRRNFIKALGIMVVSTIVTACQRLLNPSTSMPTTSPISVQTQPPTLTDTATIASPLTPTPSPSATSTPTPTITTTATGTATPSPTPTLMLIQLLSPADGTELPRLGRVSFIWETFPDAASYLLEITTPVGSLVTFQTEQTQIDRYLESLPWGGEYFWRVLAYDSDGQELVAALPWRFSKPQSPVAPTRTPGKDGSGASGSGVDPTPTGGPGSGSGGSGTDGDG